MRRLCELLDEGLLFILRACVWFIALFVDMALTNPTSAKIIGFLIVILFIWWSI